MKSNPGSDLDSVISAASRAAKVYRPGWGDQNRVCSDVTDSNSPLVLWLDFLIWFNFNRDLSAEERLRSKDQFILFFLPTHLFRSNLFAFL